MYLKVQQTITYIEARLPNENFFTIYTKTRTQSCKELF